MTRFWDATAALYEWQVPLERPALSAALDLLAPRREERLLDVGTGTGAVLRELAGRAEWPRSAVGLDSAPGMLARVGPLPRGWETVQADAQALPFGDGAFDAATAAYLLHLLDAPELDRVLSELRRVLRPGGRLVAVTPAAPRSILRGPYTAASGVLERLGRSGRGLRPFDPVAALRRAGFVPARGRYVAAGYPSLCVLAGRRDAGPLHRPRASKAAT